MSRWNWSLRTRKPWHALIFAALAVVMATTHALDPSWSSYTPLGAISAAANVLLMVPLLLVLLDRLRAR